MPSVHDWNDWKMLKEHSEAWHLYLHFILWCCLQTDATGRSTIYENNLHHKTKEKHAWQVVKFVAPSWPSSSLPYCMRLARPPVCPPAAASPLVAFCLLSAGCPSAKGMPLLLPGCIPAGLLLTAPPGPLPKPLPGLLPARPPALPPDLSPRPPLPPVHCSPSYCFNFKQLHTHISIKCCLSHTQGTRIKAT